MARFYVIMKNMNTQDLHLIKHKKLKNFDLSWVDIEAKESLEKIGPIEYKFKQQILKSFLQHISGKSLLILFLFTRSKY